MSDTSKYQEHAEGAAYLLVPIPEPLLVLSIAVLLMEDIQRDERPDLASEDTDSDNDVKPRLDLRRSVRRFAAHAVRETVIGTVLLVSAALLPGSLGLDADRLLRVAVEVRFAMAPKSSVPISIRDRYDLGDSHSLAKSTRAACNCQKMSHGQHRDKRGDR